MVLLLLQLFNVNLLGESTRDNTETNALALWLILALLVLIVLLGYVSLNDFGKRSLVKIRIQSSPLGFLLTITNVSREEKCFPEFELQLKDRNKKDITSQTFHLKENLSVESNKKWTNQMEFNSLIGQDSLDESVEWIRIKISGIHGINYYSNKLRLT